ncbi:MAG: aminotransferase class IV [Acidimicrobiia bacterium]|nr:aminotransferase class IV [Acidimicrobiia bacterium]
MRVLIDGVEVPADEASVSVFDWGLIRGFGCFEYIRSYNGHPFQLDAHLLRMRRSAAALGLAEPPEQLAEWISRVASAGGDCYVRVVMTAGSRDSITSTPPRVIVYWEEIPEVPAAFRLSARAAPWHAAGVYSELTQAKTVSYAPNMAVGLAAASDGFHDALLVGRDGSVLEGPTFSIAWFTDGVLETPTLDLGILESVTRAVVLEVAAGLDFEISEGAFPLERILAADEVAVLSTVKEVSPVVAIDDTVFSPGPLTEKLRMAVFERITAEVGGL